MDGRCGTGTPTGPFSFDAGCVPPPVCHMPRLSPSRPRLSQDKGPGAHPLDRLQEAAVGGEGQEARAQDQVHTRACEGAETRQRRGRQEACACACWGRPVRAPKKTLAAGRRFSFCGREGRGPTQGRGGSGRLDGSPTWIQIVDAEQRPEAGGGLAPRPRRRPARPWTPPAGAGAQGGRACLQARRPAHLQLPAGGVHPATGCYKRGESACAGRRLEWRCREGRPD